MIKQLSALILFSTLSFAQNVDSLKISNNRFGSDSTIVSISDTTSIADTLKKTETAIKDTLIPIQGEPLTNVSTIIDKKTFLFQNYRYTGDLLRSFNLYFIKDLGFVGYPSESFIYGVGDNGVSYLQDGIFINNRYTNSLDLNLVQSEDIDSIEIVPSPRGFLYGPYNNPVTVNFITKDFISSEPYSRIKYYQGPDGEAMIDGKFSALVAKRWNLAMEVTNRSKDDTYVNTDLSLWQANAKLKYFTSDYFNVSGSYYYVRKQQGLNGGVNLDSLNKISDNPGSDLYQPFTAPVYFPNRKFDITQHNFNLRTLTKPFDESKLDLSIYYRYGLDEDNFKMDSLDLGRNFKSRSFGSVINYLQKLDFLTFQLLGDYESNDDEIFWRSYNYTNINKNERFSFGGILTARFLDNFIHTSLYYKQNYWGVQGEDRISLHGVGADIIFLPAYGQSLYIGISSRESIYSEENVPAFEIGTSYKNSQIELDIKYFNLEHFYESYLEVPPWWYYIQKIRGLGLNFNYKFWFLLLETNTSYYFEVDDNRPVNIPDLQFIGGLYVNGLFFEDNLNLKAGFKFYYKGKTNIAGDYWGSIDSVGSTNKLDFTLAGEIKKVAIVYFIWENLFGNQYYITPYYPMPERNIRFGLAWELFN